MVRALEALRDDQQAGIQNKARRMLALLKTHQLVYEQEIHTNMLSVHPDNRSGLLVNCADVHSRGAHALRVGWSPEKLGESWCIDLSAAKKQSLIMPIQAKLSFTMFTVCNNFIVIVVVIVVQATAGSWAGPAAHAGSTAASSTSAGGGPAGGGPASSAGPSSSAGQAGDGNGW